jgi:hypothetical protein
MIFCHSRLQGAGKGRKHDCMEAGGMSPVNDEAE